MWCSRLRLTLIVFLTLSVRHSITQPQAAAPVAPPHAQAPLLQHATNEVATSTAAHAPTGPSSNVTQTSVLSNATQTAVHTLWQHVERRIAVQPPFVQHVIDAPAYVDVGPDPQKALPYATHTLFTTGRVDHLRFPHDFIVGITQAAATSEGAVKADGRGPSIWDSFAHITTDEHASSHSTPSSDPAAAPSLATMSDIANNFRFLYPLDVARAKAMGIRHYAFSVSWSRVYPMGNGEVSHAGLQFYVDLVQEIKRQELEPVVTLFQWDLPLQLELQYGGFSDERIVDDFVRYAETMFRALGPLGVKLWYTFDGPQTFCLERYPSLVQHIHGRSDVDNATNAAANHTNSAKALVWKCVGHTLKAHGQTWALFTQLRHNSSVVDDHARMGYKNAGEKSVTYRQGGSHLDQHAIERAEKFSMYLFAEPVYKTGRYPEQVQKEVPTQWLPVLSEEDEKRLKGSADFFATNFFATNIFRATERQGGYEACVGNPSHVAWPACVDHCTSFVDGQLIGDQADASVKEHLSNTAGTLRAHLRWLYDEFPSRGGMYISAMGWAERQEDERRNINEIRHDVERQHYIRDHLAEILLAIYKDGTPLKGVFFWSGMDGCEWELGHKARFGMQYVNFTSPHLTRTYLGSFFFLRHFFEKHG